MGGTQRGTQPLIYRVEFKISAAKALKKISKMERRRIHEKIDNLSTQLPNPQMTKMKGDNPFHRLRVGDFRIVYEIFEEEATILILKIGHRKEVYRRVL